MSHITKFSTVRIVSREYLLAALQAMGAEVNAAEVGKTVQLTGYFTSGGGDRTKQAEIVARLEGVRYPFGFINRGDHYEMFFDTFGMRPEHQDALRAEINQNYVAQATMATLSAYGYEFVDQTFDGQNAVVTMMSY